MGSKFQLAWKMELVAPATAMAIDNDGRLAAIVSAGKLYSLDLLENAKHVVCDIPHPVSELCLDSTRALVALATGTERVDLYDRRTGKHVQRMRREGAPGSLKTATAFHIALSPDGRMLVTTTEGSRIFVSNVETGDWEHIMFVKYDGCDVCICPTGELVGLFGAPKASELSGHLTMYRVHRGLQPLWTAWHETDESLASAQFTLNGQSIVSCAKDGARVWNSVSGDLQHYVRTEEVAPVSRAWCSDDRRHLTTLGERLTLYDLATGQTQWSQQLEPYTLAAVSLAGQKILLAHADSSLSVWSTSNP